MAAALLVAAPAAAGAQPFVTVHAKLTRGGGDAVVSGRVEWDGPAATRAPDYMSVGDLRLVAVSADGHHPTVLAKTTYAKIAKAPTQEVLMRVKGVDEPAIAAGNRVVLTASQHGAISQGTRTVRTYVTVDQLQPFGPRQDRIGRRDCADVAIVPGAKLNECDLVGADLDRALVSERYTATRMLLADLTGATLSGANVTGLSVAGGRLNGADATDAILDNLSLAGAEATRLHALGATSDVAEEEAGANIFDANLTGADFQGAVLNGVSLNHSRLDGADFQNATWNGVDAETASFRGADLTRLDGEGADVYFADFTDAKLAAAPLTAASLEWATLCHTQMPDGGTEDRDCRAASDPGPEPAEDPKVVVDGTLKRSGGTATIKATIRWSDAAIGTGMSAGDVRAVAISRSTGLPTKLGSQSFPKNLRPTTTFSATITDAAMLAAVDRGNRVVLTATQHPPLPRLPSLTEGSYVTVDTLQPGPGRGRVGSRDCSGLLLSATDPAPGGYDLCDLPGAVLAQAELSGPMHEADLSGADLSNAGLSGIVFDGSALGGADLTGAELDGVAMIAIFAPHLTMPKTLLSGARLGAARLDGADFGGDAISDTTFATSSLPGADFGKATFDKVDLAYARLAGAKLDHVNAISPDPTRASRSSLFLADLTGATLAGSAWDTDEAGERPWQWATLCHTAMPDGADISGDRDCPR